MYIIHPNVGIKMFFEFSRVFLSKKFYDKLSYVEHIVDFQRIVSPLQVSIPPCNKPYPNPTLILPDPYSRLIQSRHNHPSTLISR